MAIQQKLNNENVTDNSAPENASSDKSETRNQFPFYIHDQYIRTQLWKNRRSF